MRKKLTLLMLALCISMTMTACEKTYTGKVIDADTKEPIENAVVVATWLEETTEIAATHTRIKDVKESLTDKNGQWLIKGPRGKEGRGITAIFAFLTSTYYTRPPEFIIFKPGYCPWPGGFTIAACKPQMKGFDILKTIELPKLTKREDRLMALPTYFSDDTKDRDQIIKNQKEFIRLINEERRNLGLSQYKILPEVAK